MTANFLKMTEELKRRARTDAQFFFVSDEDRNHKLKFQEFVMGVASMGIRPLPSTEELKQIFDAYDVNEDGTISWKELIFQSKEKKCQPLNPRSAPPKLRKKRLFPVVEIEYSDQENKPPITMSSESEEGEFRKQNREGVISRRARKGELLKLRNEVTSLEKELQIRDEIFLRLPPSVVSGYNAIRIKAEERVERRNVHVDALAKELKAVHEALAAAADKSLQLRKADKEALDALRKQAKERETVLVRRTKSLQQQLHDAIDVLKRKIAPEDEVLLESDKRQKLLERQLRAVLVQHEEGKAAMLEEQKRLLEIAKQDAESAAKLNALTKAKLQGRIESMKKSLEACKKREESLIAERDVANERSISVQDKCRAHTVEMESQIATLKNVRDENNAAHKRAEESWMEERAALIRQIEELNSSAEEAKNLARKDAEAMEIARNKLKALVSNDHARTPETENLRKELKAVRSALSETKNRLAKQRERMEEDRSAAALREHELRFALREASDSIELCRADKARLEATLEESRSGGTVSEALQHAEQIGLKAAQEAATMIVTLQDENSDLTKRLVSEREEMQTTVQQLTSQLKNARDRYAADLAEASRQNEAQRERSISERKVMYAEQARLSGVIAELEKDIESLNRSRAKSEAAVTQELSDIQEQLHKAERRAQQYADEISSLRAREAAAKGIRREDLLSLPSMWQEQKNALAEGREQAARDLDRLCSRWKGAAARADADMRAVKLEANSWKKEAERLKTDMKVAKERWDTDRQSLMKELRHCEDAVDALEAQRVDEETEAVQQANALSDASAAVQALVKERSLWLDKKREEELKTRENLRNLLTEEQRSSAEALEKIQSQLDELIEAAHARRSEMENEEDDSENQFIEHARRRERIALRALAAAEAGSKEDKIRVDSATVEIENELKRAKEQLHVEKASSLERQTRDCNEKQLLLSQLEKAKSESSSDKTVADVGNSLRMKQLKAAKDSAIAEIKVERKCNEVLRKKISELVAADEDWHASQGVEIQRLGKAISILRRMEEERERSGEVEKREAQKQIKRLRDLCEKQRQKMAVEKEELFQTVNTLKEELRIERLKDEEATRDLNAVRDAFEKYRKEVENRF
eukprot:g3230.t1